MKVLEKNHHQDAKMENNKIHFIINIITIIYQNERFGKSI
jgi:hypothetical protein